MRDSQNPLLLAPGGLFNDRYQIVRCIASGGMGAVYEAVHLDTRRHRALKVMLPQLVSNDALRQRFKQEATIVANVHSQHVVEITDAGVDNATGAPFIVMELLIGHDLQEMLEQKGPMNPHQLAELMRQAALALDRTHKAGIVHRDLKPENLFVTLRDDGAPHLKILDFGIAKVVADGIKSSNQTATIGTPLYMAPEQIQSKTAIGAATDVYALAQVAYTMMVGEPYFAEDSDRSENTFQLIVTVARGVTESAKSRAARRRGVELPDAIDSWFTRATAMSPTERFASVGDLAKGFKDAAGGTGDFRMSMPDPPDPAASSAMSTGEFLAASEPAAELAKRGIGDKHNIGESDTEIVPSSEAQAAAVNGPASRTEIASPSQLPSTTGVQVARTISAAVADAPARTRSRWPLAAIAAAVVVGGAITIARGVGSEEPDEAKTFTHLYAPMLSSIAAAPTAPTCPEGMVLVARGTFSMGSDAADEGPIHKVTIGPYCIDKTEVTAARYAECVGAGKCEARTEASWKGIDEEDKKRNNPFCTFGKPDMAEHPINCVEWADADAYCRWAGKRLPSEAEWEFAARGGDGRALPWGDAAPTTKHLNACDLSCRDHFGGGQKTWDVLFEENDGHVGPAPVASFPAGASPSGALDMAGNVQEWTADWFVPYEGSLTPVEDPEPAPEPPENGRRVARGGSFLSYATNYVSTSNRFSTARDKRAATVGFRCAKTLP
jgi:formylglycine-generating enzyme required for sulfatase activity/tRNA A-37 threonylcarbamoyl transferase component Bud32